MGGQRDLPWRPGAGGRAGGTSDPWVGKLIGARDACVEDGGIPWWWGRLERWASPASQGSGGTGLPLTARPSVETCSRKAANVCCTSRS